MQKNYTYFLLPLFLFLSICSSAIAQNDSTALNLQSMVETLIEQENFNGAILYAKGENILYEKYHGLMHPFREKKIDQNSSFNLASIAKQFFGMAVMVLQEDGKLEFDDPVQKHLTDFPNSALTVRHLVTHTAGLKEYFDDVTRSYPTNHIVENEDVYRTMLKFDTLFDFQPGEQYAYSNTNFIFLAILLEKVAGMPIEQFVTERIFEPLQLNNTFAYHLKRPVSPDNRVYGIQESGDQKYLNDLTPLDGVIGDGNLYSTPRDLMKWVLALDNHRLVKKESQDIAWSPQKLNDGTLSHYGFGWGIDEKTGHYVHTGGWVGFLNIIRFDPKTKEIFIALNSNGKFESALYGQRIFLGEKIEYPKFQLISNVQIIDGTGTPAYSGSVRLRNNRIDEIGNLSPHPGEEVIDGGGKVLCPGFIDSHSHHDRYYTKDDDVLPAISQGITTIVVGQDGGSHFPLDTFFAELNRVPPSVNVASYIGHNTLRLAVMGREDFRRTATKAEVDSMAQLLEKAMEAGALGMSSGLEYDPGIYSNTNELLTLAKVLSKHKGRYISHIRSEDRELENAIFEIIEIGRTAKIPVQISHFKIAMSGKWGKARDIIGWLQEARSEGVDITADIYPYPYWLSTLQVLMPNRDFDNYESAHYAMSQVTPPEGLLLSSYDANPSYVGKTIQQIADAEGEDPVQTYMRLIAESIDKKADEAVIGTSMTESDIKTLMAWPYSNICSDGEGLSLHPRGFGAFPRVLSKYVREEKLFSLEEAIRKMTSLTAENMGISNRGLLVPGYYADLVLFDPATIEDRATVTDPHAVSEGILKVWVNGKITFDGGKVTEERAGVVIKKK